MNKNLIIIILLLLSISTSYLNYLRNESFKVQKLLLYDLNNGFFSLSQDQANSLELNYPSLAINTIPLKALKARYLIYFDQNKEALSLLKFSLNENPFSQYPLYLIAREYYKIGELNVAKNYLREGFEIKPSSLYLSSFYFSILSLLNLKNELIDSFDKIIESPDPEIWKFYYQSIIQLSHSNQDFINHVVKTASNNLNLSYSQFIEFVNN